MAENVTLARPYAEAAFALAKDSALSSWSQNLTRLANVAGNSDAMAFVSNPNAQPAQIAGLFVEAAGGDLPADQQNFVRVLVDNDRLSVLPEIAELFDKLKNAHEGVQQVEIQSAFPLDAATTQNVVVELERKFQRKIQATVSVVPELIGGVRIALGDQVIDASVRGKLAALATALKN